MRHKTDEAMDTGKDNIHLTIVTPEKTLFDGMVKYVRLPGSGGLFGVYYNHAPLISPLDKGEVTYRHGETKEHVAIERGFVEVRNNTVAVCVTETKS